MLWNVCTCMYAMKCSIKRCSQSPVETSLVIPFSCLHEDVPGPIEETTETNIMTDTISFSLTQCIQNHSMPNASYKLHCTCTTYMYLVWTHCKLRQMLYTTVHLAINILCACVLPSCSLVRYVHVPKLLDTYMYMYTVLKAIVFQNCLQTLRSVPPPVYTGNSWIALT